MFDALTSKRCYKPAWPIEKAIDLIKETRGVHFDPAVVDVFLAELSTVLEIKRRFADDLHTPTEDEESSIRG